MTYGINVTDEPQIVAEANNFYTGGTTRVPSDVSALQDAVYENILEGDYQVKTTSPTRSQTGASLATLEVDGGGTRVGVVWGKWFSSGHNVWCVTSSEHYHDKRQLNRVDGSVEAGGFRQSCRG